MTKKIILSAAIFGAVFMFGQERQKLTPEQREAKKAEMVQKAKERQQTHLDKMTTELNLSKKQVEQIKALQEKNNAEPIQVNFPDETEEVIKNLIEKYS